MAIRQPNSRGACALVSSRFLRRPDQNAVRQPAGAARQMLTKGRLARVFAIALKEHIGGGLVRCRITGS